MSKFDKVMHMLGLGAAGVLVTGLTGAVAIPAGVMIACVAVAFGTGTVTNPMSIKGLFGKSNEPPATK